MPVAVLEIGKSAIKADTEKSTLTVDENDILKMAKKIEQNENEDKRFSVQLKKFLNKEYNSPQPLKIGGTSNALTVSGANGKLDVVITPKVILKCMAEPRERYHGHELSEDILKQLPAELRNPAMIFKGSKENTLVAITELKDKHERGIIVAISLNEVHKQHEVNRISSAYGKDNIESYLKKQLNFGNLIAVNRNKANDMLRSAGLQLPLEETYISFDNSIPYSVKNVKGLDKAIKRNLSPMKADKPQTYTISKPSVLDKLKRLQEQSKLDKPPTLEKALHSKLQER